VIGSSVVQVRPKLAHAYSGLAVTLRGNPIPLSISLTSAQREVDTRLDIRIAKRGPNAVAAIIDRGATTGTDADPILMGFLDGVPPADAKEIKTSMRTVRAWQRPDGKLYLRTAVPVLSPAWSDSNSSPDGMRAYAMPPVPSIMVSMDGVPTTVAIGE
jgi:intracellular multiplication protein IcmK